MSAPPALVPDRLRSLIHLHWGIGNLRPLQERAMCAVLDGRDSIVVLPTGGGKSLCYQAPPLHRGDTINFVAAGSSTVERLAGNTSQVPNEYADGPGCDARFDDVEGLLLAGGRLLMTDNYNLRVRQATLP